MKRKKILLAFLLFAGLTSEAQQGRLVTTSLPGDIKSTIVRQYNDTQSVSYIQTASGCFFALSDNQSTIKLAEINPDYIVHDFEIYKDTICFCGHYAGLTSYGFVGWFSCPDLFWGNDSIYVYYNFQTFSPYPNSNSSASYSFVSVFSDLVMYESSQGLIENIPPTVPEGVHVVLVGETARGESCVTELRGFFSPSTNSWSYTTGTALVSYGHLDNVVTTNKYIVAAGECYDGVAASLRVFPKYAMFTSSPLLGDILHRYSSPTSPSCYYPLGSFKMTAMEGDTVALLSLFQDAPYGSNRDGFVTHMIDASDMAVAPTGSPCADNRLVYISNTAGFCSVNGLTYSHSDRVLAGLVESDNPLSTHSTLMGEQHYSFTANMDYFTMGGYYFQNHDTFFGGSGYLAIGRNETFPAELALYARHLATATASPCGMGAAAPISKYGFYLKNDDSPLTIHSDIFSFVAKPPISIQELVLNQICTEP